MRKRLRGATTGAGTLQRASRVLQDLKEEIDAPRAISPTTPLGNPIPVEIRQPKPGAMQTLAALISPLIDPLTTTGIVVIFVIFILFQQKDLRIVWSDSWALKISSGPQQLSTTPASGSAVYFSLNWRSMPFLGS